MAGIYIHIPYCKVKCHYCDFHFSTKLDGKANLLDALVKELELRKTSITETVETIYFGGGTPSLLQQSEIHQILKSVYKHYTVAADAELTFECNPDDLTPEKLRQLKAEGINRLSIGTQSFNDEFLTLMNRAHNAKEAFGSISHAKELGFTNITIDLIYGVPGSTLKTWAYDLQQLVDLDIPHLSAYCLTIEENTVFDHWRKTGKLKPYSDEGSLAQFQFLLDFTKQHGFEQYEISNFAKPGFISKHNSAYWLGKPYLGIGPSAHSYSINKRQWNIANNAKYIKFVTSGDTFYESENLTVSDRFNDYILTRLRTKWGINKTDLAAISAKMTDEIQPAAQRHIKIGNLLQHGETLFLTEKGKFLTDAISADLFQ